MVQSCIDDRPKRSRARPNEDRRGACKLLSMCLAPDLHRSRPVRSILAAIQSRDYRLAVANARSAIMTFICLTLASALESLHYLAALRRLARRSALWITSWSLESAQAWKSSLFTVRIASFRVWHYPNHMQPQVTIARRKADSQVRRLSTTTTLVTGSHEQPLRNARQIVRSSKATSRSQRTIKLEHKKTKLADHHVIKLSIEEGLLKLRQQKTMSATLSMERKRSKAEGTTECLHNVKQLLK